MAAPRWLSQFWTWGKNHRGSGQELLRPSQRDGEHSTKQADPEIIQHLCPEGCPSSCSPTTIAGTRSSNRVVMGKSCCAVSKAMAFDYVASYALCLDWQPETCRMRARRDFPGLWPRASWPKRRSLFLITWSSVLRSTAISIFRDFFTSTSSSSTFLR